MDDDLATFFGGMFIGLLVGIMGLLVIASATERLPADILNDACESILNAEYVDQLDACVKGDEVVHRFGEED